jgi:hypothetical protein
VLRIFPNYRPRGPWEKFLLKTLVILDSFCRFSDFSDFP